MNSSLIQRMRRAREFQVEVGDYKFTIMRPQESEALRLAESTAAQLACEYVVDWKGVTEADLVPSGGSDPVTFDRQLWEEWCRDRHDFWTPIVEAINEHFTGHLQKREAAAKN